MSDFNAHVFVHENLQHSGYGVLSEENAKILANEWQTLRTRVEELEGVVREADKYLDTNDLTSIGHGSIFHRTFKE